MLCENAHVVEQILPPLSVAYFFFIVNILTTILSSLTELRMEFGVALLEISLPDETILPSLWTVLGVLVTPGANFKGAGGNSHCTSRSPSLGLLLMGFIR